jgi:hypothetical protein
VKSSYAIIRSGILEHLRKGNLGYPELGIYTTIHLQADFRTGIWVGSAARLRATAPRGVSLRDVQRWMKTLTRIGFLRPFHRHGVKGNYVVLVDKYDVRIGALKGKRLNALKSESSEHPCYEFCADAVAVDDAVSDAVDAPSSVFNSQESEKPPLSTNPLLEETVWDFLKITPCGPTSFRALLESGWAARNGGPYSAVIGNAVDAWQSAEGQKLPHSAPLFSALGELRRREGHRSAAGQPNHVANAARNVLSPEGARRLKEYGVVS